MERSREQLNSCLSSKKVFDSAQTDIRGGELNNLGAQQFSFPLICIQTSDPGLSDPGLSLFRLPLLCI